MVTVAREHFELPTAGMQGCPPPGATPPEASTSGRPSRRTDPACPRCSPLLNPATDPGSTTVGAGSRSARVRLQACHQRLSVEIMGSKTAGTGHTAAVRRAHQAAAGRIEALREHEAAITETLVRYFEAKDHADRIRADAQVRAARLLQVAEEKAARVIEQVREAGQELTGEAEKHAATDDAQVGQAIRRLRELGETTASVASMTGLSPAVVRAVEREHLAPQRPAPQIRSAAPASNPRAKPGATPE